MKDVRPHGVVFAQSFSLGDVSGGAQILRSVCEAAPLPVSSVCSRPKLTGAAAPVPERVLPLRPHLSRLDRTRFAWLGDYLEPLFAPRFRRRFRQWLDEAEPAIIHVTPHGWGDFVEVMKVAKTVGVPIVTSVHDDLAFTAQNHPRLNALLEGMSDLWRMAQFRFVICDALGKEYAARYGARPYLVHSDGQKVAASRGLQGKPSQGPFVIHFMGLFLNGYRENLRCLIKAVSKIRESGITTRPLQLRFRCHSVNLSAEEIPEWLEVLPFVEAEEARQEMLRADLLYLPLPFEEEHRAFCRLSFSTKLVSYLSAGIPILYHGPSDAAAAGYLESNKAALVCFSLQHKTLVDLIQGILTNSTEWEKLADKAQQCAQRDFDPATLHHRFWESISQLVSHG